MRRNFTIHAGNALALLILVSIVVMSHWQMTQLAVYEEKEEFTFNVIQGLDRLLRDVRDVRSEQRGFTRSGDERYLESYREALKEAERELGTLVGLAHGHPWLRRRLAEIEPLVKQKLTEYGEQIAARDRQATMNGDKAKAHMAEIRRKVAAAKDEAVSHMRELTARQGADFRRMERLLIVNSGIIFLLVSTVFLLLRRDIVNRVRSEQELVRHRDHLDEMVKSRTRELVDANRDLEAEIAERTRVEEALLLKERKYGSLFENSLDGVLLATPEGRIVSANRAACELFGMTEDELAKAGREGIIDPADNLLAAASEEEAGCGTTTYEVDFIRKDGSRFPAEVSAVALAEGTGSFVMIHDITERRWAERIRRNLSDHEDMIQEQERLAISREVHDEIGQNLTALKLDLAWIGRRLPADDVELAERLREMRASVDQLIVKAQHITAELRPPLLDNLGLAAAIEWQVEELRRRSVMECHLMLNEGIEVDNRHIATTIMRIVQEALTNVIRHARATEVCISLCERDGQVVLEVSDNGCGITAAEMNSPTAYGVMGMRERALLCQGELSIRGTPEAGTTVCLTIPRHGVKEER